MTIYLAPAVCLAGLLIYWFGNPKASRIGEIMFFAGLLVTLAGAAHGAVRLM